MSELPKKEPFLTQSKAYYIKDWKEALATRTDLKKLPITLDTYPNVSYFMDNTRTIYFVRQDYASNNTGLNENQVEMVSVAPLSRTSARELLRKRAKGKKE